MLKIGLTGGIGCGKSTVAHLFSTFDIPVLDADDTAHRLVDHNQPALKHIQQAFGPDIIQQDGTLDRAELRKIVFLDAAKKQKLESILHPLIYQSLQRDLKLLSGPYCIISIPLLIETQMTHFVDRILVVDCPVETQIERVKIRSGLPTEIIHAIIDSQVPRETRRAKADDLIENSASNDKLAEEVKKLHNLYLSISDFRD